MLERIINEKSVLYRPRSQVSRTLGRTTNNAFGVGTLKMWWMSWTVLTSLVRSFNQHLTVPCRNTSHLPSWELSVLFKAHWLGTKTGVSPQPRDERLWACHANSNRNSWTDADYELNRSKPKIKDCSDFYWSCVLNCSMHVVSSQNSLYFPVWFSF